jgi:hypothetical protein
MCQISGRMPAPGEVRILHMPPVEVQDTLATADRHTFCFEVDMR